MPLSVAIMDPDSEILWPPLKVCGTLQSILQSPDMYIDMSILVCILNPLATFSGSKLVSAVSLSHLLYKLEGTACYRSQFLAPIYGFN